MLVAVTSIAAEITTPHKSMKNTESDNGVCAGVPSDVARRKTPEHENWSPDQGH